MKPRASEGIERWNPIAKRIVRDKYAPPSIMKKTGIVLHQRRGIHIRGGGVCDECHLPAPMLWKYSRSSHGEVRICGPCRDEILTEAGGADALDHRHGGGAFEMNRRRH